MLVDVGRWLDGLRRGMVMAVVVLGQCRRGSRGQGEQARRREKISLH